jgi:SAM-dependent methyltransferase
MAAALGGGGGGAAGAAEIDLREGGMLEGLAAAAERGERFDVVLASLSLHHLSEAEKARAVEAVGRVLAPGGAFVICDIFLLPGEARRGAAQSTAPVARGWCAVRPPAWPSARVLGEGIHHCEAMRA